MHTVNEWATLICLSAFACTIIELMLPSGKMEKMLRFILRLFVLISLIFSVKSGFKKIDLRTNAPNFDFSQIDNFTKSIEDQTETLAQENIKGIIKSILKEMKIKSEKIEIFMDTNQEKCISISKCKIYISRESEKLGYNIKLTSANLLEIKRELEKRLNIETEVVMM